MNESYNELCHLIRRELRDIDGLRYSDSILFPLIHEAQREYAMDTGKLSGECNLIVPEDGVIILPHDFIYPMLCNLGDNEIPIVSRSFLESEYGSNWKTHSGDLVRYLCFDCGTYGTATVYPRIKKGSDVGILTYARLPTVGIIEFIEKEPLIAWVRFYLSMIECDKRWQEYYKAYKTSVLRHNGSYASTDKKASVLRGRYF